MALLLQIPASVVLAAGEGTRIVDVAIGPPGQVCALQSTGTVWCWGTGILNGQESDSSEPRVVPTLSGITKIAAGSFASCAISHDGEVRCWGTNLQAKSVSATPFTVTGLPPVAEVAIGFRHMCARTVAGDVLCWGANPAGELGDGRTTDNYQPTRVEGVDHAVSIDVGVNNTCVADAAGAVKCWGTDNQSGVAEGRGFAISSKRPETLVYLEKIESVQNGRNYACGRDRHGAIFCWGSLGAV
ncbi:MAG: hypothetical protein K2Y51_24405, partial [Gammaproteobacteria bacterium]|nr:hypothetical protein [Gammaproteobacteria bacterium]